MACAIYYILFLIHFRHGKKKGKYKREQKLHVRNAFSSGFQVNLPTGPTRTGNCTQSLPVKLDNGFSLRFPFIYLAGMCRQANNKIWPVAATTVPFCALISHYNSTRISPGKINHATCCQSKRKHILHHAGCSL